MQLDKLFEQMFAGELNLEQIGADAVLKEAEEQKARMEATIAITGNMTLFNFACCSKRLGEEFVTGFIDIACQRLLELNQGKADIYKARAEEIKAEVLKCRRQAFRAETIAIKEPATDCGDDPWGNA